MKKLLSLCLAFAMILSLGSPAYADNGKQATAMETDDKTDGELLYDLGIITGSNGGELNEEKTIDRQEMISILVRLLDLDQRNDTFKAPETPSFEDVPTTHWAYRDIELAYSLGLTSGIGDNQFGLGKNISNNQATLFLLRSLGYDTKDIDYAEAAKEISEKYGFKLETEEDGSEFLERGQIFELIAKALDMNEFDSKEKKIYKLGYDEERVENFLNGRSHTKNYKTGEVKDLRLLDNYIGQLERFIERLSEVDTDEAKTLLADINLDAIKTKEQVRDYMKKAQKIIAKNHIDLNEDDSDKDKEDKEDDLYEKLSEEFPAPKNQVSEEMIKKAAGDNAGLYNVLMGILDQYELRETFLKTYMIGDYETVKYNDFLEVIKDIDISVMCKDLYELNPEYLSEGQSPYEYMTCTINFSFDPEVENAYSTDVESSMGRGLSEGNIVEIRKYEKDGALIYAVKTQYLDYSYLVDKEVITDGFIVFKMVDGVIVEAVGYDDYGFGIYKN